MLKVALFFAAALSSLVLGSISSTAQDCPCGRRGCSGECSSRAPHVFIVKAQCSRTGAVGMGRGTTQEAALYAAVNNCIANGGIPECCRQGAQLMQ